MKLTIQGQTKGKMKRYKNISVDYHYPTFGDFAKELTKQRSEKLQTVRSQANCVWDAQRCIKVYNGRDCECVEFYFNGTKKQIEEVMTDEIYLMDLPNAFGKWKIGVEGAFDAGDSPHDKRNGEVWPMDGGYYFVDYATVTLTLDETN